MNCHCGQPLHYTDVKIQEFIEWMIGQYGEFIHVTVGLVTYKVPRHYIALHGIKAETIHTLGFENDHDLRQST